MTRRVFTDWWNRQARNMPRIPPVDVSDALPAELVWYLFDVWLEQAKSLKALDMEQAAERKLRIATDVAIRSINANSDSASAWINLARVRIVSENYDGAVDALNKGKYWAEQHSDTDASTMALHLAAVLTRQRANTSGNNLDGASGMFYVCQKCGHFIYYVGGHCPYCKYVPTTIDETRLSCVLSRRFFRVDTLLDVALKIQFKSRPEQFMVPSELQPALKEVTEGECIEILQKIKKHSADDHLDFASLECCGQCKTRIWESWADVCSACVAPLERPSLAKFVICVERVL
ncbi:MAG: hypothetical protein ACRDHZ_21440, partial [Ktedonobacteraceae bacterium]